MHKRKNNIKKKESLWIFRIKEKLILKMIFLWYLRDLHDIMRNENNDLSVLKTTTTTKKQQQQKNDKMILSLAWIPCLLITKKLLFWNFWRLKIRSFLEPKSWWKYDIYWLLKSSCFKLFGDGKYGPFLSQKVDGNVIFTDYWKVLVLSFSEMGNTVFLWAKKLIERWYLLITEKLMFWTFPRWKIRSFFKPKSW